MRKKSVLILILITLFSCSYKSQSVIENIFENFSFNNTVSNSTQIIIKTYDSTTKKRGYIESDILLKEFKTENKQQIIDFDKIFVNAEKTDYCCCPISTYSIHFFDQKEELDFFYVDTLEFKDKVRICENSFQYSYIIEKQKWKDYLAEIEK
ncbi:hypothetical protein AR687_09810 [Flavobacteriaceae bacterium CRH]|nr:hypothetical protein AR687_09810 [Flavobacteriaceae bacterium CRH]